MSSVKEPHNYAVDERYNTRFSSSSKYSYLNIFEKNNHAKYFGESSTIYLGSEVAPERIKADCPDAKFIFLFRDPIERIKSHYNWLSSFKHIPVGRFDEEIEMASTEKFDPNISYDGNYKNYIGFSQYGQQLQRYLASFNADQILIITTEHLKTHPLETLKSCYNFLDVEFVEGDYTRKTNATRLKKRDQRPKLVKDISRITPDAIKKTVNNILGVNKMIQSVYFKPQKVDRMGATLLKRLKTTLRPEVKTIESFLNRELTEWENFKL